MGITKTKYVSTFMFFPLYFEDHLESSRLRIGSSTESPISYEIQDIWSLIKFRQDVAAGLHFGLGEH